MRTESPAPSAPPPSRYARCISSARYGGFATTRSKPSSTPPSTSERTSEILEVTPASAAFTSASRKARGLTSQSTTLSQRDARTIPPAPQPAPTSTQRRAPPTRDSSSAQYRYVSGPKKTASDSRVGYAEWTKRPSPSDE